MSALWVSPLGFVEQKHKKTFFLVETRRVELNPLLPLAKLEFLDERKLRNEARNRIG